MNNISDSSTLKRIIEPGWRYKLAEILDFLGARNHAVRLRWTQHNINKARDPKCLCGAPGTIVQVDPYPVPGGVQPEFWFCVDHLDVLLTTPWKIYSDGTGRPMVKNSDGVWE